MMATLAREASTRWIFISHASADLLNVRKIRNYLEDRGAAPLLFNLRSLNKPENFWPIIEDEIKARYFFLFCDSPAAATSEWVVRERRTIEDAAKVTPRRIFRIDVSDEIVILDAFLARVRIFVSYSHHDAGLVAPFINELRRVGFDVFDFKEHQGSGARWDDTIITEVTRAAYEGWVLAFLTKTSISGMSPFGEVSLAQKIGAEIIPVLLDDVDVPWGLSGAFDARDRATAPQILAEHLAARS